MNNIDKFNNKRILIIEDDDKLRFNLEKMVANLGHFVQGSFANIESHLDEITDVLAVTDLILLDINLPGQINGVQFARTIKDEYEVPILFVTGNVEEETFKQATESRIYGYLPKPFTKLQLDYQIKMCLFRFSVEKESSDRMKKIKEKEKLIQVGEFAGGFVHDLNNFNTLIMNSYGMIKSISKPDDQEPFKAINSFASRGELGANKIKQLADRYRKIILNQRKIKMRLFN